MTTDPKPHERPHSEEVEVESDEKQDGEAPALTCDGHP